MYSTRKFNFCDICNFNFNPIHSAILFIHSTAGRRRGVIISARYRGRECTKRERGQSMLVQTTPTYDGVTPVTTRARNIKSARRNQARMLNRVNTRCAFSAAQGSRHNGHEIRKRGRLRIIGRSVCVASNREVNPLSRPAFRLPLSSTRTHIIPRPPPFAQRALQRSHRRRERKSRSSREYR